jgi:hypothetical protein
MLEQLPGNGIGEMRPGEGTFDNRNVTVLERWAFHRPIRGSLLAFMAACA